jgi:hypothetical protein
VTGRRGLLTRPSLLSFAEYCEASSKKGDILATVRNNRRYGDLNFCHPFGSANLA